MTVDVIPAPIGAIDDRPASRAEPNVATLEAVQWLHPPRGEPVIQVGVRELRNNLSRYLERVRGGEDVIVTDRGRAVARVLPVGTERVLDRLIAEGVVIPAPQAKRPAGGPIKGTGTVSDLVAEQRR